MLEQSAKLEQELIAIRRQIHQNPELSGNENNTRKIILENLKGLDLEIVSAEKSYAVVAYLKGAKQGKTIMLRADMDALPIQEQSGEEYCSKTPNIAHTCGHDMHTTALIGCAKLLCQNKEKLNGNIVFLFQPSEENLNGALKVIEEKLLDEYNIEAAFCLHSWPDLPVGQIGVKKGPVMASADSLELTICGQSGHAAYPDRSVDAVAIAANIVVALQTVVAREIDPVEPAVLTFGTINGGVAHNIIAQEVNLTGTARAFSHKVREQIPQAVERISSGIAKSMRGEAHFEYIKGTPPLINDDNLVDVVIKSAIETIGKDNVISLAAPSMGGEDFAFYLEKIPGCMFRMGTRNDNPQSHLALHNPKIIFDDKALKTGVAVMVQTAINYLK